MFADQPDGEYAGSGSGTRQLVPRSVGNKSFFFLVLKEGCRTEALAAQRHRAAANRTGAILGCSWRINCLMRLGRTLPDLPADLLFEPDEWRAAFILNKKPVPRQTPTLNTVVRLIAQRGGFLGRKHDGEPGAKTIWLGM